MGRAAESSAGQAAGLTKSLEICSPTGKKPTEAADLRVMNTEGYKQHKKPGGHAESVEPKRPGGDLSTHMLGKWPQGNAKLGSRSLRQRPERGLPGEEC